MADIALKDAMKAAADPLASIYASAGIKAGADPVNHKDANQTAADADWNKWQTGIGRRAWCEQTSGGNANKAKSCVEDYRRAAADNPMASQPTQAPVMASAAPQTPIPPRRPEEGAASVTAQTQSLDSAAGRQIAFRSGGGLTNG